MIVMYILLLSTAVPCVALTNLANGQVGSTGTTFGQIATYSCNTGYNLVGNNTRMCQATGVWSGSAPTCQGMVANRPPLFSSICIYNNKPIFHFPVLYWECKYKVRMRSWEEGWY